MAIGSVVAIGSVLRDKEISVLCLRNIVLLIFHYCSQHHLTILRDVR